MIWHEQMRGMANETFGRPIVVHFVKCDTLVRVVNPSRGGHEAHVVIGREDDECVTQKMIRVWSDQEMWSEADALMAGISAARKWFKRQAEKADESRAIAAELPRTYDEFVAMTRFGCGWVK